MSRRAGPPPTASDPFAAAAARFRDDLTALVRTSSRPDATAPVLLAVSGGADSMAMLTLAAAASLPGVIAVATVDHRLRASAADEAAMVAAHCAAIGVAHTTLSPPAAITGASIQAQARTARYALLADHARVIGAAAIATAHHVDDQAETFLMRAARTPASPDSPDPRAHRDRRGRHRPPAARLAAGGAARDRALASGALRRRPQQPRSRA